MIEKLAALTLICIYTFTHYTQPSDCRPLQSSALRCVLGSLLDPSIKQCSMYCLLVSTQMVNISAVFSLADLVTFAG